MNVFVPYVTFIKHAEKVIKSSKLKTRPIFQTVLHKDSYVAVTDNHRLYFADNVYEGEEKTIDLATGQAVDRGTYPDITKLIQDESHAKITHIIDVLQTYEAVRAIEIASKINRASDLLDIEIDEKLLTIKTTSDTEVNVNYSPIKPPSDVHSSNSLEFITFNIKYIKELFHLLKDARVYKVTLQYFGNNRPMQFHAGNFTAVIMPIRRV